VARILGYIAASLDGFIAGPDEDLTFLDPWAQVEAGYDRFIAGISTVVMGRRTYNITRTLSDEWPYAGRRTIVLSREPLADPPPDVTQFDQGLLALLVLLRGLEDGDVWAVGGGRLYGALIAARAFAQIDLFLAPVFLGGGTHIAGGKRLGEIGWQLAESEVLEKGLTRLRLIPGPKPSWTRYQHPDDLAALEGSDVPDE